jgi:hypothetical protein
MNKDEALKMAIEALETCETYNSYEQSFETILVEKAINACKEAINIANCDLKQPAQEPVGEYQIDGSVKWYADVMPYKAKLYTHPNQWQGLTDDDLTKICEKYWDSENGHSIKDIILMVQQALKEKNT